MPLVDPVTIAALPSSGLSKAVIGSRCCTFIVDPPAVLGQAVLGSCEDGGGQRRSEMPFRCRVDRAALSALVAYRTAAGTESGALVPAAEALRPLTLSRMARSR